MKVERNSVKLAILNSLISFSDEWEKSDPYFLELDNPATDISTIHKKWGIPEPGFPEELESKAY